MIIPSGAMISYLELANRLGNPKLTRAVAKVNSKNPMAIVIPCHRVIGTNGNLTGYAGGLHRKRNLLDLEQIKSSPTLFDISPKSMDR